MQIVRKSLDNDLTPSQIVDELDKYIIGQKEAKKAVAVALRNRWRRKRIDEDIRDEVAPKNIIMMGPTGVGKTEIARRLAKLVNAPFIKVEATKYTEIGYVGRDVESMIRDLVNIAINDVREIMRKQVEEKAVKMTEDKLVEILLPSLKREGISESEEEESEKKKGAREAIAKNLEKGKFDDTEVELRIKSQQKPPFVEGMPGMGSEDADMLGSMLGSIMPQKKSKKKVKVRDARRYLLDEFTDQLIDMDKVVSEALSLVENMGIVFLDELDKIATPEGGGSSHQDVARHGVQRDLLPVVEGTTVNTRYGSVKTDHILFIAAGAFHYTKPSDLIPELQGRFPIRVELAALTNDDFKAILTLPKNALTRQYQELLKTEEVNLEFSEDSLSYIAQKAFDVNTNTENIGARRLHTIMEKILEDISFNADKHAGETITVNKDYAEKQLGDIAVNRDLSRYIL